MTTLKNGLAVQLDGYGKFRKECSVLHDGFKPANKAANLEIAQKVSERAVTNAESQGGVAAFVVPSIVPSGTQTGASIRLGAGGDLTRSDGTTVPAAEVAPGAEFGSFLPQFEPFRGNSEDAGYFVYPTIREMQPEIQEMAENSIQKLIDQVAK